MRPVDLILPSRFHRIPLLADLAEHAVPGRLTNGEVPGTPLGIVGTVGLLVSLGAVFAAGLGARVRGGTMRFVSQLGVLNLFAIVIGSIGGFAFLLALSGFRSYRTWNRISVFIAFSSLLVVAVMLEKAFVWLRRRFADRRALRTAIVVGAVAVICVGAAYDQITPFFVPPYKTIAAQFDNDATFYHSLEHALPKHTMVSQLPVQPFPEAGQIVNMTDYQHFTGYLHTDSLRWSYGGIKGRQEGDWQQNLSMSDPVATVAQLAAAGFQGAVIDVSGFSDSARGFLKAVQPFVGSPVLTSPTGALVYLDLAGLRARLTHDLGADAIAADSRLILADNLRKIGFEELQGTCATARWWATSKSPTLEFTNPTNVPLPVTVSSNVEANAAATRLDVRGPNLQDTVPLAAGRAIFERQLTLPPGKSRLQFSIVGPPVSTTRQFALTQLSLGPNFDAKVVDWAHARTPGCTPS